MVREREKREGGDRGREREGKGKRAGEAGEMEGQRGTERDREKGR